ncbi:MAG: hypothetical protein LBH76_06040, partial [Propionibacteriaceae bacterium]|nr:hypothetical protein [Propionibacteriaceae bacterium]
AVQKDTVETIKSVLPPKVPAHQKKLSDHALAAVYRWVAAPGPENAQRSLDVGNECPDQPGGLLSLSAFWSFGNLMPTGEQVIPAPPGRSTAVLLLAALHFLPSLPSPRRRLKMAARLGCNAGRLCAAWRLRQWHYL